MSDNFELKVKLLSPNAHPPARAKPGDAGWDVVATEDVELAPNTRVVCALGFATEFPESFMAMLRDRSSLGSKGIHCLAGVIDSSYRGEWKVVLLNTTTESHAIKAGDRIAQCLFLPVPDVRVEVVETLEDSQRGAGGFGSTGT
jgi:dUTP pyrophosphatase